MRLKCLGITVLSVMLFLFARPAAQPFLDAGTVIIVPATGILGVAFLLSSILYIFSSRRLRKPIGISFLAA